MSLEPSTHSCPQRDNEASDAADQHASSSTAHAQVHNPIARSGSAGVYDREPTLHASREADAAVHVEAEGCNSEADSGSDSDYVSSADTSNDTDSSDDEHYSDDSDDSGGPGCAEEAKEGLST
jgi:hypothetical protein